MYNQLTIQICSKDHNVFLQEGFYSASVTTPRLHNHHYEEIHIISNGTAVMQLDDKFLTLSSGDIIIIPRGVYHCFFSKDSYTLRSAFQIDCNVGNIVSHHIGNSITSEFFKEIRLCASSGDYSTVCPYISLFCAHLCGFGKASSKAVADYGFLIHEFFSRNYSKNIHLFDLAQSLHLSERQTARLVLEHTGNTFRKELIRIRLNIAKKLVESGMSMKEAADYVGYNSYTGFWKAIKNTNI